MPERKKIEWLAVLQGFSMLLVVIGHVSLTNKPGDPTTPIATGIERTIYSFHMPLFIFISGWLFYYTCIKREKLYKDMLVAKVKRLVIPFFVFTIAAMLLKIVFPSLMHRKVDMEEIVDTFVLLRSNPLGEMWFIVVLFELMLLYPVYKFLVRNRLTVIMGIICAVILSVFTPPISYFYLRKVAYMIPFFVLGIVCCRYEWQKYMGNAYLFVIVAGLFVVCNVMNILPDSMAAVTALIGILFVMSFCLIVAKYHPNILGSYRDYTFQIFLMGIFFQMAIRWLYVKIGNETLFVPMWLLSVAIGIYVPTFIAIAVKKNAIVRLCLGL